MESRMFFQYNIVPLYIYIICASFIYNMNVYADVGRLYIYTHIYIVIEMFDATGTG